MKRNREENYMGSQLKRPVQSSRGEPLAASLVPSGAVSLGFGGYIGSSRLESTHTLLGDDAPSPLLLGVACMMIALGSRSYLGPRDDEKEDFQVDTRHLTISAPPSGTFTLEIVTEIYPQNNTSLEGLYKSSGNFCTQCEAQGFRKITFYQDRPDIMAKYTCRTETDKTKYPILLSNGNLIEQVDLEEHGQRKGDDLLASCRIVGSCLAESPAACKEKIENLLEYILIIEGENEPSPFYSTCFMLPWMCQITMEIEGCRVIASSNGLKQVADCLTKLINLETQDEDGGTATIFLACDIILNLLLKKEEIPVELDESSVVDLLKAIASWIDIRPKPSVMMMGASICSLVFDNTSEQTLLNHPGFKLGTLNRLTRLITTCLTANGTDSMSNERDLVEIIAAGYARWVGRFPHIEESLKR